MNVTRKLLALLLSLVLTATLAIPSVAAEDDENSTTTTTSASSETTDEDESLVTSGKSRAVDSIITSYNNQNGRTLSMAKSGNPRVYPEDSLSGLEASIDLGVDIVSVKVQKTKDGQLILLEDSTIDRMLVHKKTKKSGSGKVKDFTLEELQTDYVLRDRSGGSQNDATKQKVPTLEEALEVTSDSIMLYISNGWKYAKAINKIARETDTTDVLIIGGATSPDAVKSFISKTGTPICHIATRYVDGTTKDSAKNFIADSLDAGADSVFLESGKNYSSIFKEATLRKFQKEGRAIVSATDLSLDGERKDTIEGWEELINCGYGIIETDYPWELAVHLTEIEAYRSSLTSLITQAQSLDEDSYSRSSYKALKQALEDAEEITSTGRVSLTEIDNARYTLQETIDALEYGTEVPKEKTPVWKILLIFIIVVAVIALLVVLGLRFFNRRKKYHKTHDKVLRKFKAQSESNLANAKTAVDETDSPITTDGSGNNILDNLGGDKEAAAMAAAEAEMNALEAAQRAKEEEAKAKKEKRDKLLKPLKGKKSNKAESSEEPASDAPTQAPEETPATEDPFVLELNVPAPDPAADLDDLELSKRDEFTDDDNP